MTTQNIERPKNKLYRILAGLVLARSNCMSKKSEFKLRHEENILDLVRRYMPSGSGVDVGTTIDLDKSTSELLVFNTSFHHMNYHGMYDGWTEHVVSVKPSLCFGMFTRISGKNRNQIKDYLHDLFWYCLEREIEDV